MLACSLVRIVTCDPPLRAHPACKRNGSCAGHLAPDCTRRATVRLTSSTDPWPQQYACDEHAEEVAGEDLDVITPLAGPRFYIVSEGHGLVGVANFQDEADQLALVASINTGRTSYVHDRNSELVR